MNKFLSLISVLVILTACSPKTQDTPEKLPPIDNILVKKAERKLFLRHGNDIVRSYHIALGGRPEGHKTREGDNKTPEGRYKISGRNPGSLYHRSLRISYPDANDRAQAKALGVSPGGDIMIHGYPNRSSDFLFYFVHKFSDWTQGCIAVTNDEIEEIWRLVPDGTPITIEP